VLGLSGGVDSALVAALAKRAVGRKRLLCLLLPCGSSNQDQQDAKLMIKKFGLKYKLVEITPIYKSLCKILPWGDRRVMGNLKARLRMLVIYYFANKLNYLVCGTGNKSELLVGYFTKYGDGGVDILPLASLLKKEVRELARELGVPRSIIDKHPTAGLWAGQTDEKELGISYNELDSILFRLERKRKQVSPPNKVKKVQAMIKSSQHKRQPAAIFRP